MCLPSATCGPVSSVLALKISATGQPRAILSFNSLVVRSSRNTLPEVDAAADAAAGASMHASVANTRNRFVDLQERMDHPPQCLPVLGGGYLTRSSKQNGRPSLLS